MAKLRIDILDAAKYTIALMLLYTVGHCTIQGIEVERQMWAVASSVLTYMFTIMVPHVKQYGKRVSDKVGMVSRAVLAIGFIALLCWCTIAGVDVGKELWALTSSIITFVFVSQKETE